MMTDELAKRIVAADKKGRDLSFEIKKLNRFKQTLVDEVEEITGGGSHEVGLDSWSASVYYAMSHLLSGQELPDAASLNEKEENI